MLLVDETSMRKRHRYVTVIVNGDTLTDADRARLDKLFDAHPRLRAGWQALQELHGLYTADDYDGALEALGGSATSTRRASCPSTTHPNHDLTNIGASPSTRSSPGPTRSSTGTVPAGLSTAESRAPTTCSKSCDAPPTGSPTHATSKPAAS